MFTKAKSRIKKAFNWYKFTGFALYLIILLILASNIALLDRGLHLDNLRLIVLLAAVVSLLLSIRKKIHPLIDGIINTASGIITSFLIMGNLAPPFNHFLRATIEYFSNYWRATFSEAGIYPDVSLLQQKWILFEQAFLVVFERFRVWITNFSDRAYDPVSLNLAWGIAAWIASSWIYWGVVKKKNALVGFLPPLLIIAGVIRTAHTNITPLYWVLGIGLLVDILAHQSKQEDFWKKYRLSISVLIRRRTVRSALSLSFGIVLFASFFTSPRLDEFIDDLRQRNQPVSHVTTSQVNEDEIEGETGPSEVLGEASFGRFPNTHLVGSGPELAETEVMYVRIEDPYSQGNQRYYLRSATYDTYTVHGWLTADKGFILYPPTAVSAVEYSSNEKLIYQEVNLLEYSDLGNLMYSVGEIAVADVPYYATFHTKFKNNTYTDIFATVTRYTQYAAYSIAPHFGENELRQSSLDYPAWITSKYLQIPDEVPDRVYSLSLRLTATQPTPYDRAVAIEEYLRGFEYTLDLDPPPSYSDLVDYFIFDIQKGYCDYFASSMVVLARAAGIPARLVTGYVASNYDAERDHFVVTADQAHSWAELYFTEFGWVVFEATPGRPSLERLDEREDSEVLADQIELDSPDQNLGDRVSEIIPNNFFALFGQITLLAVLGVFASYQVEFWILKSSKPNRMFAKIYHRLRKLAKALRVKVSKTDTPLEFSDMLAASLTRLGSNWGPLPARVLHTAPQTTTEIIAACNQAAYAKHLPEQAEIDILISSWWHLRMQFLAAQVLLKLIPLIRWLRRVRNRLR